MSKSVNFQVRGNRIQFRCPECKAKRNLPVPQNVRWRTVRCHKCESKVRCNLNRRVFERLSQSGKAVMILREGQEIPVDLFDISSQGVGCDVPPSGLRKISINDEVKFKCSWSMKLFSNSKYTIANVKGNRVGSQISGGSQFRH